MSLRKASTNSVRPCFLVLSILLSGLILSAAAFGQPSGVDQPSGLFFHNRVIDYLNRVFRELNIRRGDQIALVFMGINNRFEDAWQYTKLHHGTSDTKVIAVPTYDNFLPPSLDLANATGDYLMNLLPRTRKIALDAIVEGLAGQEISVVNMTFSSGANFVLEHNRNALVRMSETQQKKGVTLPTLSVVSGAISRSSWEKLGQAGYSLNHLGESEGIVPALQRKPGDSVAGFWIVNPLALPAYFSDVVRAAFSPNLNRHGAKARQQEIYSNIENVGLDDDEKKYIFLPSGPGPGGGGPGGPGPGGGGDFGSGGTFFPIAPFSSGLRSTQEQLGGIDLSGAQFPKELSTLSGRIAGAILEDDHLVLLTDNQVGEAAQVSPDDLALAQRLVFDPRFQEPQFSLDPADPSDPDGDWLKAVYIPELISATPLGALLFQADWSLKEIAFNVRVEEDRLLERNVSIPGFQSLVDLSLDEESAGQLRARLWITVSRLRLNLSDDGRTMLIEPITFEIKARKQVVDPGSPTGLRDVDSSEPGVETRFAEIATHLFDPLADSEAPSWKRLHSAVAALAFWKWIKDQKLPITISSEWLEESTNLRDSYLDRIRALKVGFRKTERRPTERGYEVMTSDLRLSGGVDLTLRPAYRRLSGLQIRPKLAPQHYKGQRVFEIDHEGRRLEATVLPVTPQGYRLWNTAEVRVNGSILRVDRRRRVIQSLDEKGITTSYRYGAGGELESLKSTTPDGWTIEAEQGAQDVLWTATQPDGSSFGLAFSPEGELTTVMIAGLPWLHLDR